MKCATVPIADPTHDELVSKAVGLQPLLRRHAVAGDAARRTADEVVDSLTEAGFFRLHTPRTFGGYEVDVRTVVEITEMLGAADGSAAWLVGLGATASWMVGRLSDQAQSEIFAEDSNARVAAGSAPARGRRVAGGFRFSGRWPYASGSAFARWAACPVITADDSGATTGMYYCMVPATELRLDDTWRTTGMRGTASNTWVGEDIFVPDYRVLSAGELDSGDAGPRDRLPFAILASLDLLGPILGIGRAALDFTIDKAPTKAMHHTFFASQSDSVGVQVQIAEAALQLETARLHAYSVADQLDRSVTADRPLRYDERAKARAQCGYAARTVIKAIETLVDVHGAGTFAESNPLQQFWRDANTAARHASFYPVVGYEIFGKSLLGVDERISAFV